MWLPTISGWRPCVDTRDMWNRADLMDVFKMYTGLSFWNLIHCLTNVANVGLNFPNFSVHWSIRMVYVKITKLCLNLFKFNLEYRQTLSFQIWCISINYIFTSYVKLAGIAKNSAIKVTNSKSWYRIAQNISIQIMNSQSRLTGSCCCASQTADRSDGEWHRIRSVHQHVFI